MGAPKSSGRKLNLGEAHAKLPVAKKVAHPVSKKMTRLDIPEPVARQQVVKFSEFELTDSHLTYKRDRRSVSGAKATVEAGASARTRMTATRVLGGAAVLGPLGAIIGGLAKKDESKVFLIVEMRDGTVYTEEVHGRKESEARKFAGMVNTFGSR
ncbi:hypothetical protein [Rhodococcoides fascians]|uniref:hypothetical protein n=1 Tax=Rhodococcoides fascians TaxID=1828 RepID=UPI00050CB000|nr:hypothetical protein [Rhodococcus fascians]